MLDTPITTRDDLIKALQATATLEHAIMCQYLFAAFTMKRHPSEGGVTWVQLERMRTWHATMFLVARQEMEHLGLVCNLLTAVGGKANFTVPPFPHVPTFCTSVESVALAPFSRKTLHRFMVIEKGHTVTGATSSGTTIGDVYRHVIKGIETLQKSNARLFIGRPHEQVVNATIDLRPKLYDMQLNPVHDFESARRAVNQIMESSDTPPEQHQDSHYLRFKRVHDELRAMQAEDPTFDPARPIGRNLVTRSPVGSEADRTLIHHPVTRMAAHLFNEAYETMLLMLSRFFAPTGDTPAERAGLKKIIFFPMMTMILRPLGEILTLMPAHHDRIDVNAGPTFEACVETGLHPYPGSAWIYLHERFQGMGSLCADLKSSLETEHAPWAGAVRPRVAFLDENLSLLASNFARVMNLNEVYHRHLLERVLGRP